MSNSYHSRGPTMALLGLTVLNVLVIIGLFPNTIPAIQTPQAFILAAVQIPIILWIYRYIKRSSEPNILS